MPSEKISVFIICFNEERNIGRALASVCWADEIVAVDSGSTDQTLEICRRFTDKIYSRPFDDYASQKNYALSLTKNNWVLSLDADEEVSAELGAEIQGLLRAPSRADGYRLRRRSSIFGRFFKFTGTQHDKPLRLFDKNKGRFTQPIHEMVEIHGNTACLKSFLNHYTYVSIKDYLVRLNRYTSMEADYFYVTRKVMLSRNGYAKSLVIFLKLYFLELGFLDGREGFFYSWFSAYYFFIKHAKYAERTAA